VLDFACGASVANLYYAQPLLDLIGQSLGVSRGTATIVVTPTQIGYALGLALLLPLGDLLENRRLTARTLLLTAVALAVAAFAPGFWVFAVLSALIGVTRWSRSTPHLCHDPAPIGEPPMSQSAALDACPGRAQTERNPLPRAARTTAAPGHRALL
jgi:MFS family permease